MGMKIRFIGGGAMATAIIKGIVQSGEFDAADLSVIEPNAEQGCRLSGFVPGVRVYSNWDAAPGLAEEGVDLVVLAVKPQQIVEALAPVKKDVDALAALMSIAAGVRVATLSRLLSGFPNIIRVMPNTAVMVGAGIAAAYSPSSVNAELRERVARILSHSGVTLWFDDEAQIDVMTAMSGSGPAYVYFFMECLENAALALGIDSEIAHEIAIRLIASSATMAHHDAAPFAELRARVTSKGGTTEAALKKIAATGFKEAFVEAVKAAHLRSIELGDELDRQLDQSA